MKRRSSGLLLIGALILAVGAGFGAVQVVRGYSETVPAIVAARDIPPYTRLDPSMLKVEEVPLVGLPPDVFRLPGDERPATDTRQLAGQYTAVHVLKGDVIRTTHLAQVKGDRSLMSARLSALGRKDLRAFALPFDPQSAVGGEVRDGDRVDIVASVRIESPTGTVGVGKVIARNVLVLKAVKESEGSGTLVLALTPSEIEDVAFALSSGRLMFALNPYETDEQAAVTPGVTGKAWLEKYGFLVPVEPGR
ncbi:MAG: Flp pilus assembly protein CpaB [Bacillota bacterium]